MKALEILRAQKAEIEKIDIGTVKTKLLQEVVKDLVEINEAIAELEKLNEDYSKVAYDFETAVNKIAELEEAMKPKSCEGCVRNDTISRWCSCCVRNDYVKDNYFKETL